MLRVLRSPLLPGLVMILLIQACSGQTSSKDVIVAQLEQDRVQKDAYFKSDSTSPLLPETRADFSGLQYFPIDLAYHLETEIREYPEKDTVTMKTTKNRKQTYLRWGWFDFSVNGNRDTLEVFKPVDISSQYPPYFFIPFHDATNNNSTYGGGRYLDLRVHESNRYVIDFNQAYNPYCAYNKDEWSCPIPPSNSRVDFAIKAGEKMLNTH